MSLLLRAAAQCLKVGAAFFVLAWGLPAKAGGLGWIETLLPCLHPHDAEAFLLSEYGLTRTWARVSVDGRLIELWEAPNGGWAMTRSEVDTTGQPWRCLIGRMTPDRGEPT